MTGKLFSGYAHYLGVDEFADLVDPGEEAAQARVTTVPAGRDSRLAVSILPISVIS
ncbi:hypothetical protein [Streptomyces sp. SID12501]|uniref:Uncharacterized protein n=1 Tax=Streptomyces sp. SID12501 TaxID=2706042 RepID=A0A6B3BFZ2_9ACTN|nr:hypothetical protein [Streptomyces sp. SID12501]NEC84720.1 hypothetical protein [Streptomyces sp. SID12501]